jgi:hypothetical protein
LVEEDGNVVQKIVSQINSSIIGPDYIKSKSNIKITMTLGTCYQIG